MKFDLSLPRQDGIYEFVKSQAGQEVCIYRKYQDGIWYVMDTNLKKAAAATKILPFSRFQPIMWDYSLIGAFRVAECDGTLLQAQVPTAGETFQASLF